MRNCFILFLCGTLIFPVTSAKADAVDKFHEKVKDSIKAYNDLARFLIKNQKDELLGTHVTQGFDNSISIVSLDQYNLMEHINKTATQIDEDINKLIDESSALNVILNEEVALASYREIIERFLKYKRIYFYVEKNIEAFKLSFNEFKKDTKQLLNFCDQHVDVLNVDKLDRSTPQELEEVTFESWDKGSFWNMDDPVAEKWMLYTASAVFVMGMFIQFGAVVALSAGIALFMGGAAIAAGGTMAATGVGIIIIVVAAAIGYIVGCFVQKKRKEDQEERVKKILEEFEKEILKTQEWFKDNRLTTPEFKKMAMDICVSLENDLGSKIKGTVSIAQINETKVHEDMINFIDSKEFFLDELSELEENISTYELKLRKFLSEKFLRELREEIESEDKVVMAWEYFNNKIKPSINNFVDIYLSDKNDCVKIKSLVNNFENSLNFHYSHLDAYKDVKNKTDSSFINIRNRCESAKQFMSKYLDRCLINNSLTTKDITG